MQLGLPKYWYMFFDVFIGELVRIRMCCFPWGLSRRGVRKPTKIFRGSEGGICSLDYFWYTLKSMAKIVAVWWDVFLDAVWSSKVLVHVFDVCIGELVRTSGCTQYGCLLFLYFVRGKENIATNNGSWNMQDAAIGKYVYRQNIIHSKPKISNCYFVGLLVEGWN